MAEVLQKFRFVLILLGFLLLALILWLIISRQNAHKIPSRGVFVIESTAVETGLYTSG